jgi:ParE toxin of type II toxin-antitoxin system, parDE
MDISSIEFDGDGDAENDLARLWTQAPVGKRERITVAANDAEVRLLENPEAGSLITDGVHPAVRYLDCDVLRVFYQIYESEKRIIIVGFRGLS